MHVILVHRDEDLGEAWEREFGNQEDVDILSGDILSYQADAIVSPANSFGFMDGGLDLALSEHFGWELEERLRNAIHDRPLHELLVGEALLVPTHDDRIPWLLAAPTMRVPMEIQDSVNAYLAMKAICSTVMLATEINSVLVPGLGTGVGKLSASTCAGQMFTAWNETVNGQFTPLQTFTRRKNVTLP